MMSRSPFSNRLRGSIVASILVAILVMTFGANSGAASRALVGFGSELSNCSTTEALTGAQSTLFGLFRAAPSVDSAGITSGYVGLSSAVCQDSALVPLLEKWGSQNLSLGFEGNNATGVSVANLTLSWTSWTSGVPTRSLYSIAYNLGAGSIVGPTIVSTVSAESYGDEGNSVQSHWNGFDFTGAGPSYPALEEAYGDTKVVPMGALCRQQQQVPPNFPCADAVAAVWIGLENTAATGLLQTGYAYDATNPSNSICNGVANSCDYGLWWENIEPSGGGPPMPYSGDPVAQSGQILEYTVTLVGTYGSTEIFDQTTGNFWTASTTTAFSPTIAPYIVEAFKTSSSCYSYLSGKIMIPICLPSQIADFSANWIDFEYGYYEVQSTNTFVSLTTAFSNFWFGTFEMEQAMNNENLGYQWQSGATGFLGGSTTLVEIPWFNSNYNWCYLSGNEAKGCP